MTGWIQRLIVLGLMWPLAMVIVDEFADEIVQLLLAKDDESAEALDFEGLNKPLDVCIQIWTAYGKRTHFNAFSLHDRIEHARELSVTIADQVACA